MIKFTLIFELSFILKFLFFNPAPKVFFHNKTLSFIFTSRLKQVLAKIIPSRKWASWSCVLFHQPTVKNCQSFAPPLKLNLTLKKFKNFSVFFYHARLLLSKNQRMVFLDSNLSFLCSAIVGSLLVLLFSLPFGKSKQTFLILLCQEFNSSHL